MESKGQSGEISDRSEDHMIGKMEERQPLLYSGKQLGLAKLSSTFLWKVELVNDEVGYLAEEISVQSVEGVAWFLRSIYSKMQGKKQIKEGIVKQK